MWMMARAKSEKKNRVKTMTFRILEEASFSDTLLHLSNDSVLHLEREDAVSNPMFQNLSSRP